MEVNGKLTQILVLQAKRVKTLQEKHRVLAADQRYDQSEKVEKELFRLRLEMGAESGFLADLVLRIFEDCPIANEGDGDGHHE